MKDNGIIRSPFFYVGDKYKLMPQLKKLMPKHMGQYIEPFVGGGSSFLNSEGSSYVLNDVDYYVVELHRCIGAYAGREEELFKKLYEMIDFYGLSCSFRGVTVSDELKSRYKKTYYSVYNKEAYARLRSDFNRDKSDLLKLYLLLIYGFNHMIRFNGQGEFNLPVGNVDFNGNVQTALHRYLKFVHEHDLTFYNMDYTDFLGQVEFENDSYVFLDPPYLISMSEYNKLWNDKKECELCEYLDGLNDRGIKFGITNLITHKGKVNQTFLEWSKKYQAYDVKSNYISFNDNTIKADSQEVFVTNYEREEKRSFTVPAGGQAVPVGRKAQRKPLSFSTTMRNPNRIVSFLNCLLPYEDQKLTHEMIMEVMRSAIREKLYKPVVIGRMPELKQVYESEDEKFSDEQITYIMDRSPQQHKEAGFDYGWDSRFDTIFKLPMEFGFVSYAMNKPVRISNTGHMLIDALKEEEPNEGMIQMVFLNSMMKYQSNNPFRKNANANVPLILLLQVLKLLKQDEEENDAGVFRQELSLFICWPDNDAQALYQKIKEIRAEKRFSYSDEYMYEICLKLLGAKEEQKNRFKMSQICGEAVDEYIRKMRTTGIISLRGNGRFIDYNKWEEKKIDYILARYARYREFDSQDAYFTYMGMVDPAVVSMGSAAPVDTEDLRRSALRKYAEEYSKEAVFTELRKVSRKAASTDYVMKLLPAPVRLEFLTSIAMVQQFEALDVVPNYSVDDEGFPTNTASGGKADIVCRDEICQALLEVSLMCGRHDQVNNEIVPIRRHLRDEKKNVENTFSVFVAPAIHEDTRECAQWYKEKDSLDIMTYTVDEFIKKIQKSRELEELKD